MYNVTLNTHSTENKSPKIIIACYFLKTKWIHNIQKRNKDIFTKIFIFFVFFSRKNSIKRDVRLPTLRPGRVPVDITKESFYLKLKQVF